MTNQSAEKNRIEAEIQMIQDEIDRRHERIDAGFDVSSNNDKIDALRDRRAKLREQLSRLS